MTSHGFGVVTLQSTKPTPKMVADLARRISRIKPIVWTHVVAPDRIGSSGRNKNERYSIIFEFDELFDERRRPRYRMNHSELRKLIKNIPSKNDHKINVDLWVIQRSYHNGC